MKFTVQIRAKDPSDAPSARVYIEAENLEEAKIKAKEKFSECYDVERVSKLNPKMHDSLELVKSQLFDAPSNVKQAFNSIVEYFSAKEDIYDKFVKGKITLKGISEWMIDNKIPGDEALRIWWEIYELAKDQKINIHDIKVRG